MQSRVRVCDFYSEKYEGEKKMCRKWLRFSVQRNLSQLRVWITFVRRGPVGTTSAKRFLLPG